MSESSHRIDGLEIDRLLARGGSASVYEAFDRRHSRKVAVKVLDRRDLEEPKRRAFRRELEAMGRLDDHPYVLSVFDSGFTEDGSPYLVMPLVTTGTVANRITRGEAFETRELLSLAVKLASALETAHRRGILHCDVKPSNLFIGPFGDPMLGDLGISSVSDSGVTATNRVSITLRYAAPEIIEGADHSVRSDIYSLGATLHAMVELAPPFDEATRTALASQIMLAEEPPRISRDIPPEFAVLIYEMMSRDPDARPASALSVVERLRAIERSLGLPVTAAAIVGTDERPEPPHTQPDVLQAGNSLDTANTKRRSILLGAALVVALIAGLGLLFSLTNDTSSSSTASRALSLPTTQPQATAVAATPTSDPASVAEPAPTSDPTSTVEPTPAEDEVLALAPKTVKGTVLTVGGELLEDFNVELFAASDESPRGDFLEAVETDETGTFGFLADPGCYVLTFVAPEGSIVIGGSQHRDIEVCSDGPQRPAIVNVTIAPAPERTATISGLVRQQTTDVVVRDVLVDAFLSEGDGVRGAFVASTRTSTDGTYGISVAPGCYIVTISAPEGTTLVGGDKFLNSPTLCLEPIGSAQFSAEIAPE